MPCSGIGTCRLFDCLICRRRTYRGEECEGEFMIRYQSLEIFIHNILAQAEINRHSGGFDPPAKRRRKKSSKRSVSSVQVQDAPSPDSRHQARRKSQDKADPVLEASNEVWSVNPPDLEENHEEVFIGGAVFLTTRAEVHNNNDVTSEEEIDGESGEEIVDPTPPGSPPVIVVNPPAGLTKVGVHFLLSWVLAVGSIISASLELAYLELLLSLRRLHQRFQSNTTVPRLTFETRSERKGWCAGCEVGMEELDEVEVKERSGRVGEEWRKYYVTHPTLAVPFSLSHEGLKVKDWDPAVLDIKFGREKCMELNNEKLVVVQRHSPLEATNWQGLEQSGEADSSRWLRYDNSGKIMIAKLYFGSFGRQLTDD